MTGLPARAGRLGGAASHAVTALHGPARLTRRAALTGLASAAAMPALPLPAPAVPRLRARLVPPDPPVAPIPGLDDPARLVEQIQRHALHRALVTRRAGISPGMTDWCRAEADEAEAELAAILAAHPAAWAVVDRYLDEGVVPPHPVDWRDRPGRA